MRKLWPAPVIDQSAGPGCGPRLIIMQHQPLPKPARPLACLLARALVDFIIMQTDD